MEKGRHKGFTLVELLITLVIIVAVASVAAPRFSRALIYVELRNSTQEIAATLRQARSRSITESQVAEIIFDRERQYLRAAGLGILYEWPADIHVGLAGVSPASAHESWSIRFFPDGTATDAALTVSAERRDYTITVDWLTGRVRVL